MKVAIIGLGPMGRRHIQVVKELGLNIVGLCDKSEDAIQKVRETNDFQTQIFFKDANEMFEKTKPEVVIIATNSDSHYLLTKLSVENKVKHILCEKPMANSVEEAMKMLQICKENGVVISVNHQQRFMECYQKLKNLVKSEKLGGLETISIIGANCGLAMIGSHYINLSSYLFEDNFCKISALLEESKDKNPRGDQFKDPGGVVVGYTKNGKKMVLSFGVKEGYGITMVLSCKYGNIIYNPLTGKTVLHHRREEDRQAPTTRYGLTPNIEEFNMPQDDLILSTKRLLQSLLNSEMEFVNLAQGAAEVIKVIAAAYLSSERNGVLIDLEKETLPLNRKFPWP